MKCFYILPIVLLLAITKVQAQRWELRASGGIGFTRMIEPAYPDMTPIISYSATMGSIRSVKNFRLGMGITYLSTGYGIEGDFTLIDPFGNPYGTTTGEYIFRHTHLGVPFTVGYNIKIIRRLSFIPVIGVMPTYNIGARERMASIDYGPVALSKNKYDNSYKRFSLLGIAQTELVFDVNKRLSISAAPSFRIMLMNISKLRGVPEQDFAVTFEAGVGWKLP